jgi:outer membrane protein assembly factor BamB
MKDRVLNWALLAAVCFVLLQFSSAGRQYTDTAFSRIKGVFSAIGRPAATERSNAIGRDNPLIDPLAVADNPRVSAGVDLPGLPAIAELPPVVPGSAGRISAAEVAGPHQPHVEWNLAVPDLESRIGVIGSDGTIYISGTQFIGAVRDGKFLWAYQVSEPSQSPTLDDDGRICLPGKEDRGEYCLNVKGEGGYLNSRFMSKPPQSQMASCTTITHNVPQGVEMGSGLLAFGRQLALDYRCIMSDVGPDETVYVATEAPDIRAVTRAGTVAWTLKTPCPAETLLAGPSGRVLFSCKDGSLHFLDNGALGWVYPGEGEYLKFLMDREGITYFVNTQSVDPIAKRFLNHPATHIHAMSSAGRMLWTMETSDFFVRSIQLDGKGRLYLSGPRGGSGRLVCLSD